MTAIPTSITRQRSYGHSVKKIGHNHYRLSWTVDFHYANSRLRHPRGFRRDTDLSGASRFARKWSLGEIKDA